MSDKPQTWDEEAAEIQRFLGRIREARAARTDQTQHNVRVVLEPEGFGGYPAFLVVECDCGVTLARESRDGEAVFYADELLKMQADHIARATPDTEETPNP